MHIDAITIGMFVLYIPPQAKGDRQHKDVLRGTVQYKSTVKDSDIVFVKFDGYYVPVGCHAADLK